MSKETKACPILNCRYFMEPTRVMCHHHWFMLDRCMQNDIWALVRSKDWPAWRKAMAKAVDHVNEIEKRIAASKEARNFGKGTSNAESLDTD